MPDELKRILARELDELKQNKIRVGALIACFVVLLIFWIADDSSGDEEIILTEEPPVTKDLPVKVLPQKSSDGVKVVLGANANALFIGDPFAVEEEKLSAPPPEPPPKIPAAPVPIIPIQPPPQAPIEQPPKENFVLIGTAISGANKTAMFLRGSETLFLTIGEEIGGRKISDITPDFVTFEDGERIYFQKGMS